MRNRLRVLAFDLAAPALALAALAVIGFALSWPLWWVSVCSILCLLIVEGVVYNFVLARRDLVTVGTDDDGPGLRLVVVTATTAAVIAAVVVCYTNWARPDATLRADTGEVVNIASSVAEATATFSPQDPTSSVNRAAELMVPEQGDKFKTEFAKASEDLVKRGVSAQATTVSAGLEAIGPTNASVAVLMHGTQNAPGQQTSETVLALRITLVKNDGKWLVFDVIPINAQ